MVPEETVTYLRAERRGARLLHWGRPPKAVGGAGLKPLRPAQLPAVQAHPAAAAAATRRWGEQARRATLGPRECLLVPILLGGLVAAAVERGRPVRVLTVRSGNRGKVEMAAKVWPPASRAATSPMGVAAVGAVWVLWPTGVPAASVPATVEVGCRAFMAQVLLVRPDQQIGGGAVAAPPAYSVLAEPAARASWWCAMPRRLRSPQVGQRQAIYRAGSPTVYTHSPPWVRAR